MNTTKGAFPQETEPFAHRLLDWYRAHARRMPWRVAPDAHAQGVRPDPYHTWLSEVMLQQTQVATVKDYFLRFISQWPSLEALAESDLEAVLKAWAGLGYYSRARNLKRCANTLIEEHDGRFPRDFESLKALPGIGEYTAAAIAAIAHDVPVAVVDGNVERVMARHARIDTPFPTAKGEVRERVARLMDRDVPGEFAQAMMDLGAMICTPKKPACGLCPVQQDCAAYRAGDAEHYPRKLPKKEKPLRRGAAFVLARMDGAVFLCKRAETGLLGGMTQVPTSAWNASQDGVTGRGAAPVAADWRLAGKARHTFTHFHLELEVWSARKAVQPEVAGWWCAPSALSEEALPTVMRKVLAVAGYSVRRQPAAEPKAAR